MNATPYYRSAPGRIPALTLLFARCVTGQIAEATWSRFTEVFDAADATPEERLALAGLLSDTLDVLDPREVEVPDAPQLKELLGRAA